MHKSLYLPFTIRNGMRQGCSLSPLLSVLTMKHPANALQAYPSVCGLTLGFHTHKLTSYVYYLLLYISSHQISIPNILAEFARFRALSNFNVNTMRSDFLNISLPLFCNALLPCLSPSNGKLPPSRTSESPFLLTLTVLRPSNYANLIERWSE